MPIRRGQPLIVLKVIPNQQTTTPQQIGEFFKFFAACFYPPDGDNSINTATLGDTASLAAETLPELASTFADLRKAYSSSGRQELLVDFTQLFIGPFTLTAPPFGSIYLETGNRLMGETTMAALKQYQEAGISLDENLHLLPDHIAVELEFMHYLLAMENLAAGKNNDVDAQKYRDMQKSFFNKHLARWGKSFCNKIQENAASSFYRTLALALAAFLEWHQRDNIPSTN